LLIPAPLSHHRPQRISAKEILEHPWISQSAPMTALATVARLCDGWVPLFDFDRSTFFLLFFLGYSLAKNFSCSQRSTCSAESGVNAFFADANDKIRKLEAGEIAPPGETHFRSE
jgi:hypothetical protein